MKEINEGVMEQDLMRHKRKRRARLELQEALNLRDALRSTMGD